MPIRPAICTLILTAVLASAGGARRPAALQPHELRGRDRDRRSRTRARRRPAAGSASIPASAASCCKARCRPRASTSMPARCRSMAPRRCRRAVTPNFASATTISCSPALARAAPAPARSSRASPRSSRRETEKGHTAYLAEEAEYSDDQARDAAIQRLLDIAGYDVSPIDGIRGAKTDAALLQFIADNKLDPDRGRPLGFLRRADRRRAAAGRRRLRLVQRNAPRRDGGARRRGERRGGDTRLVPRRARQMPAARAERASCASSTASPRRSAPTASRCSAPSGR